MARFRSLLALLPILVVLGSGRGLVWCTSPSGHAQVEIAAGTCCPTPAEAAPADRTGTTDAPDDCNSCSDVAIPAAPLPGASTASAGAAPAAGPEVLWADAALRRRAGRPARSAPPGPPGALARLRGVVLRC